MDLEGFFSRTFEEKLLAKIPAADQGGDNFLTPATKLLEKRREMSEVECSLASQKEEFKHNMEAMMQQRSLLDKDQAEFAAQLIQFESFLKQNEIKKMRSKEKAAKEITVSLQKTGEIKNLVAEKKRLISYLKRQNDAVSRLKLYKDFLDKTLRTSSEYSERNEILDRMLTLKGTNQDLLTRNQSDQNTVDGLKADDARYKEDKLTLHLEYNNELATLQKRLEEARTSSLKWADKFDLAQSTASSRTQELGQLKMATQNLHALVLQNSNRKGNDSGGAEKKDEPLFVGRLGKIQEYILDLSDITERLKEKHDKPRGGKRGRK